jgi:hypothetical protein
MSLHPLDVDGHDIHSDQPAAGEPPGPSGGPALVACAPHDAYRAVGGMLCQVHTDRFGQETIQQLANFTATIDAQIARDDGHETSTFFEISGRLATGKPLPSLIVPTREYASLGWITRWGHGPTVFAGGGRREHLRVAIDVLSRPAHHQIYSHSGWRRVDDRWAFLFHGGAVGAENVSVALAPPLDRVSLPDDGGDPVEAMRWSLRLLDCAPPEVTMPLLGAVYAAPLSSVLPPDFVLWLAGSSGSFKSAVAGLAQAHFGATFDRTNLPAQWSGSEAALEQILAVMKDVVCVVDDFAPQPDRHSQHEQARRAEHIVRSVGNRASRARMRHDGTARPARPPRGLVISTGEDVPRTPSILARLVCVEVERDRVDLAQLTALQNNTPQLARAMRAFVAWLAPMLDELARELPARVAAVRDEFHLAGSHARQPNALAVLSVGIDLALQFAAEIGAISNDDRQRHLAAARASFVAIGAAEAGQLEDTDPARRFIEVLREELARGHAELADKSDPRPRRFPDGELIGYRDADHAFLLPEVSRRRVGACLRAGGEPWEVTPHTLHRALVKRGFVIPGSEGRPESKHRIAGARLRVLVVPLAILLGPPGPGPAAPCSSGESGGGTATGTRWLSVGVASSSQGGTL